MKIYAETTGDNSVGIHGDEVIVEWVGWSIKSIIVSEREEIRDSVTRMVAELSSGGRVTVWFEDECCTCGSTLVDGECRKRGCIENQEECESEDSTLRTPCKED